MQTIIETLSYAHKFCGNTLLIKLGGSILHDNKLIQSLCEDLKLLIGVGIKIVLVHGGSKAIQEALTTHHIQSEFIDGLRVTTPDAMKIIEMVLCGHVNKLLVRQLNTIGIRAVGLSGTDDNMLQCDYFSKRHGCVGTIRTVNPTAINNVLSFPNRYFSPIPVIAPIGVDQNGNAMNINADLAACQIAKAIAADKLIYLTDQDGIYDLQGKIFSEIYESQLQKLIDHKIVTGGMLIKTKAILQAIQLGMHETHILNGNTRHVVIEELFTVNGVGTLCKKSDKSMAVSL